MGERLQLEVLCHLVLAAWLMLVIKVCCLELVIKSGAWLPFCRQVYWQALYLGEPCLILARHLCPAAAVSAQGGLICSSCWNRPVTGIKIQVSRAFPLGKTALWKCCVPPSTYFHHSAFGCPWQSALLVPWCCEGDQPTPQLDLSSQPTFQSEYP